MPGKNLTRSEAQERAAIISQVHGYDIVLNLANSDSTFQSTTTIDFSAQAGANTFIDLIADSVQLVELNGQELPTDSFQDHRIPLPNLEQDNHLVISATCRYTNTGEGMHRFVDPADGNAYLYTQFEVPDARRVYACFEQPDLKSRITFHVTAPAQWSVISNEPTTDIVAKDATRTWHFAPTSPISTYITALVAGPYHEERSTLTSSDGRTIDLGVFCRASIAQHLDAEEIFDITRRGFAFYEEAFDRPYPFTKYDQLFVPEYNAGAMENAGCVTYRDQYVFTSKPAEYMVERRAVTILHELAHMWFGDLVTMKWWNDLWLNESFAEFMCTLSCAEATRWEDAWTTFAFAEKAWAYMQDQLPSTHPIVAEINDLEDVEVNFDGITYAKGAAVLRALVAYVGREEFFAGVRAYFKAHEWGNTELPDFLSALEQASGRDLQAWSKVWLEEAGLTIARMEIESDDDGTIAQAAIVQESFRGSSLRPHRMTVGAYDLRDGVLTRIARAELDVTEARTAVPDLAGVRLSEHGFVLVNDEDLAYTKIRLPREQLAQIDTSLMEDSRALAVLLGAAWDMLRDGLLPGRLFVELAAAALSAPGMVPSVRYGLLGQIRTAATTYTTLNERAEVVESYAAQLYQLLTSAPAGSDEQLLYAQEFAQFAYSPDQIHALGEIYRGSIEGLVLDDSLQWTLLRGLVATGAAGADEIQARRAADPSLSGGQEECAAWASVPTAAAKQEAFTAIMEDTTLSNDELRATIAGFFARSWQNPELVEPYVEPYFAALTSLWQERSGHMAQLLVGSVFPRVAGYGRGTELAEAWLAEHADAPAALLRMVREAFDGRQRAEKIQQVGTEN